MKRLTVVLLLLVLACSSDTGDKSAPRSGTLVLSVTAGGTNDGAMVIVISGGPVTAVDAEPGYDIASNADSAGTHIMVMGNLTPGPVATLTVPDIRQAAAYAVTLEQVADRTTFGLLDPAPYHVEVHVP